MSWRKLEIEIIDILRKECVPIDNIDGDTVVPEHDSPFILFSITELAKELVNRGIR